MRSLVWFVLGLAGGFVAAHVVNKDPRGHELLAQVDAGIGEFTDRVSEAYREQEAQFAGHIDEVRDAAADADAPPQAPGTDPLDAALDAAPGGPAKLTD